MLLPGRQLPAACTFVNVITAGTEHWAILGALDCLRLHLDNVGIMNPVDII